MSINISTSVLRNCVVDSLQAEIDFRKYQGLRRRNLIKALRGEKRMADTTIMYIQDMYNLPRITAHGWRGIAKDSGFWEVFAQAIALTALKGITPEQSETWYKESWHAQKQAAELTLAKREVNHGGAYWYFTCLNQPIVQTWVEPVDKSNGVWPLIDALERGENPQCTIKFGNSYEYIIPEKSARRK